MHKSFIALYKKTDNLSIYLSIYLYYLIPRIDHIFLRIMYLNQ